MTLSETQSMGAYVKQVLRVPHFWIILAIMGCGAFIYYADQIPVLEDIVAEAPVNLARYSTHRILSVIPVAYAAFIFRFRFGAIIAGFISLALLPRALFLSEAWGEALAEIVAFLFIGLLVSWLIDRQRRAVHRLENAQRKLSDSLQTIRQQQQKLATLYAVSSMFYQKLDADQIAARALQEVLAVAAVDIGWIYLKDEETGDLILSAHHGLCSRFISDARETKSGKDLNDQVAKSGEPIVIETGAREYGLKLSGRGDIRAILTVPLGTTTGNQGTLGIAIGDQQLSIGEDLELLIAVGNEIGKAIEHVRFDQKEKIATQQLRTSEERYRGLFENASEAIFVCSSIGRIIAANRACKELTAYNHDEIADKNIYELFSDGSLRLARRLLSAKPRVGIWEKPDELCLVRKDGTEAFVKLRVSPLMMGEQVIGMQVIALDVTEERQLQQNMQHYITQVTRAQEDERLRISRELHDDTAQLLASLSRGLDSLISRQMKLPELAIERLKKLHQLADYALQGVRRFSQDLRPSVLDDLGLIPALEWLIANLEKRAGVATKVSINGKQRRLLPEKELTVFRIAQESINNIRKHAEASAVELAISYGQDALTLIISDNGKAFDMPQRISDLAISGKLGIVGMRERARLVGGTLIVQAEVGKGTTVALRMPD